MLSLNETTNVFIQRDEDHLLELLGELSAQMQDNPAVAADLATFSTSNLDFSNSHYRAEARNLGYRIFIRIQHTAFTVVCQNSKTNDELRFIEKTLQLDQASAAAALTGILTGSLGVAPTVAIIVSCLLIKIVFVPAKSEICKFWGEKLHADEKTSTGVSPPRKRGRSTSREPKRPLVQKS